MGLSSVCESALRRLPRLRLWLAAIVCLALPSFAPPAKAVDEAEAAKGPPFDIAVFISSRSDACYEPGNNAAIKRLVLDEQKRINRLGGILGRPIQVNFLDDSRDDGKAIANMHSALEDPRTLAMIGLSGSNRPKAVFDALGPDIAKSAIPFLSDISVNKIFEPYPNVFTMRASQDDDRIPIMAKFPRLVGYQRPAYVGLTEFLGSSALGDGLKAEWAASGGLVADHRLKSEKFKIDPADMSAMVADLKEKKPDIVYLGIGGDNTTEIMSQLVSAGVTPALFVGGNIDMLPGDNAKNYPNAIYALAWDHPPEVYNSRIRTRISPQNAEKWIFEGAKNPDAPGWATKECTERPQVEFPDPFNEANMRAITRGSQYADIVNLIVEAARTGEKTTDISRLRARVIQQLASTYAAGRGEFKGTFDNWSFVAKSRAAARDPFVIILPQGLGRTQLAPIQFVHSRDGTLRQIETLYADIDLIKAHRIDENEKSFYAEFYLALRNSHAAAIDKIEFVNAYLETKSSGGRQIAVEPLHEGGASQAYPDTMKIYRVAGRFLFEPELAGYPFDTQRFSIDIEPKDTEHPFIVQPPPLELRDKSVNTDGWDAKEQYVGFDNDFVPVVDAFTHAPSVVPFYKSSFVWQMRRQTTDYLLRVAVPLGFILFVAYLSIFIPRSHFEAIVTIQVTALLSAVALYLSLPKLDSDVATLSDRAFVFAYMIVSTMIAISILRINPWVASRKAPERALEFVHIAAIPIFVAVATYYVQQLSVAVN